MRAVRIKQKLNELDNIFCAKNNQQIINRLNQYHKHERRSQEIVINLRVYGMSINSHFRLLQSLSTNGVYIGFWRMVS